MTARDELAEKVKAEISHHIDPVIGWLRMDAANGRVDSDQARLNAWRERLDKAADAIADLVKPRTITTVEELDALRNVGTAIEWGGRVYGAELAAPGDRPYWFGPGRATATTITPSAHYPATVIHEGAQS